MASDSAKTKTAPQYSVDKLLDKVMFFFGGGWKSNGYLNVYFLNMGPGISGMYRIHRIN